MERKAQTERYGIANSGLYRLRNRRALARLLQTDVRKLKSILSNKEAFYFRKEELVAEKLRSIQCPIGLLRRIHERLKALLNRLTLPDYLHAPRHKTSYITNAIAHADGPAVAKLDIKQFYPSVTSEHVFQFFKHRLQIVDDVAGLLTQIVTIDEHLPFGSPASPILAFHAHRDLFDAVDALCEAKKLKCSLYVDDLTISGPHIPKSLIFDIRSAIQSRGLKAHKIKRSSLKRKAVITGIQLSKKGLAPSNKMHLRMKSSLQELDLMPDGEERLKIVQRLLGQAQQMIAIYAEGKPVRRRRISQKAWLIEEQRRLQRLIDKSPAKSGNGVQLDAQDHSTPF